MKKQCEIQTQKNKKPSKLSPKAILTDLREMISKAKEFVSSTVNSSLTLLYWHIGHRI